jgi:hypothetical protein
MIVFAHAGHWLVQLLYLAPLVVLVGILVVTKLRDRRHPGEEPVTEGAEDGHPDPAGRD